MTAGTTKNCIHLTACGMGTDYFQRIGRQITVTSINIKGCIQTPSAQMGTNTYSNCVTVYVVQDRQVNGTLFTASDFLVSGAGVDPATTMRNLTYRSRFRILAVRRMVLIGGTNANRYYFEINIRKPIKVTYTGTGANVADVATNAIYFVAYDDLAATSTDPDTTHAFFSDIFTRTRFIDP